MCWIRPLDFRRGWDEMPKPKYVESRNLEACNYELESIHKNDSMPESWVQYWNFRESTSFNWRKTFQKIMWKKSPDWYCNTMTQSWFVLALWVVMVINKIFVWCVNIFFNSLKFSSLWTFDILMYFYFLKFNMMNLTYCDSNLWGNRYCKIPKNLLTAAAGLDHRFV